MSAEPNAQRLKRLHHILSQSKPALAPPATDTGELLASVSLDRIDRLTSEQHARIDEAIDDVDMVAMRLLLNEYMTAVGALRAVARLAEQRVDAAWVPIDQARRLVRRELKPKRTTDGS